MSRTSEDRKRNELLEESTRPERQARKGTRSNNDSLLLSVRDRKVFLDALLHPSKPNERLRRAFRDSRERVAE